MDSGLVAWLQSRASTAALRAFTNRYTRAANGLALTFSQEVAEQSARFEFLTSTHPVVQLFAAETFKSTSSVLLRFRFAFPTLNPLAQRLPKHFVILVGIHKVSGIRPRREMVASAMDLSSMVLLEWDKADELLLACMRSRYSAPDPGNDIPFELA